ncbi:hypothetical protein [Helicobacter pylori]|uniref:hypothetical protein n=1 Tax=Helicobacter pylori TaxID=210 RepID=UPI000C311965|nr:hypothetical protein [Helicobacter pylori]WRE54404.1 hypothetical protein KVC90_06870 [Helicobacter pylori]
MGVITNQGYQPSTPQELQEQLVNYIKINNPNFTLYPADLQSDLINTSIADLFQYEKLTEMMLNTIAPNQSNEWLFNEFADFFGLSKNETTNNCVVLKVSNLNPNAYIPSGLTWSCSAGDFINNSPSLANDKGVAMVVAINNELTTILTQNQSFTCSEFSNATITNPNNSILQDAESFFDFKTRIQNNFKANTQSSYNLLATELANIGITNFNVYLNAPKEANNYVYSQTLIFLPSVINNETAIKELIFGSMGVNCLLSGTTSDNDNSRVRESNIDFFGNLIPIVYVIAKQVTLDITININLNVLLEVWSYFTQQLENAVTEFFANQKIGNAINIFMLNNLIYQTLNNCSISMDRLEALSFNFSVNGEAVNINSANQELECVAFDTQLQLGTLNVTKATN